MSRVCWLCCASSLRFLVARSLVLRAACLSTHCGVSERNAGSESSEQGVVRTLRHEGTAAVQCTVGLARGEQWSRSLSHSSLALSVAAAESALCVVCACDVWLLRHWRRCRLARQCIVDDRVWSWLRCRCGGLCFRLVSRCLRLCGRVGFGGHGRTGGRRQHGKVFELQNHQHHRTRKFRSVPSVRMHRYEQVRPRGDDGAAAGAAQRRASS